MQALAQRGASPGLGRANRRSRRNVHVTHSATSCRLRRRRWQDHSARYVLYHVEMKWQYLNVRGLDRSTVSFAVFFETRVSHCICVAVIIVSATKRLRPTVIREIDRHFVQFSVKCAIRPLLPSGFR